MEDMGAGVVGGDAPPALFVDLGLDFVADRELAEFELDLVDDHAANRRIGVQDAGDARTADVSVPMSPTCPPDSA